VEKREHLIQAGAQKIYRRILPGALFAIALILMEAGMGAFMLARDAACREQAAMLRNRFAGADMCLSDETSQFAVVLLRGPFFMMNSEVPVLASLGVTLVIYGLLGAGVSLLRLKWSVLIFLFVHVALVSAGILLGILSMYTA